MRSRERVTLLVEDGTGGITLSYAFKYVGLHDALNSSFAQCLGLPD
jgi:hypothetical protein